MPTVQASDLRHRPVWAEIDLDAVRSNIGKLRAVVAPSAVLAVVKADAYGHGAVPVARAVVEAGAAWLGVALVEEGVTLRAAGIDAPILVLSEPTADAAPTVVAYGLTPVVYSDPVIDALAAAVRATKAAPLAVHVKIDTGMHRVGAAPDELARLAAHLQREPALAVGGVLTHLAVADEPDRPETAAQLATFAAALASLPPEVPRGLVHVANSAGALTSPAARFDLVRPGIAVYGIPPAAGIGEDIGLRPALSLKAQVSCVQDRAAGDRISYGLRYALPRAGRVATIPVGYADGVPRALGANGGEALVHGRRVPIAGTITMDQLMLDAGDLPVVPGDEVVLLGAQGDQEITATEWARRIGTIPYEIVTSIGPRVPRRYLG